MTQSSQLSAWKFLLLLSAALMMAPSAFAKAYLQLGPQIGHVGADEARIWVKASESSRLAILVSEQPDLKNPRRVKGPELKADADFMGHVVIPGLNPSTRYYYSILLDGSPVMQMPYPSFETAPRDGAPTQFRFAFISCIGRYPHEPGASWGDLDVRTNFNFLLMLGDNHYADSTQPEKQRAAYYMHRNLSGYRSLTARTPTYAIWDDHDFGPNDSDGTAKGKELSLQTFKQFWANPAYGHEGNPGVYYKFSRGDVDFFMLDGRYHRTPNKAEDDGSKTLLGEAQLSWLKRELVTSKAKVKFIAVGSEWQSHGTEDSWTSFARERQNLFKFIEDHSITGVLLLSGDRHFTGAYQVQGKFIEATSGPFGGGTNTKSPPTPEMFMLQNQGKYYSIYNVDTRGETPKLSLEVYRVSVGLVEKHDFTWDQVLGKTKIPALNSK